MKIFAFRLPEFSILFTSGKKLEFSLHYLLSKEYITNTKIGADIKNVTAEIIA